MKNDPQVKKQLKLVNNGTARVFSEATMAAKDAKAQNKRAKRDHTHGLVHVQVQQMKREAAAVDNEE
jgi:hypothetical protein